ncbi:MAG: prepilin peptidase [Lachnospiraceae bacterium]|nr:prepilin peptidase [Lachnospiraceae bacterium]
MSVPMMLAIGTAAVAVFTDLTSGKVFNGWIIMGWITGAFWQISCRGPGGILSFLAGAGIPFLFCGWLAVSHMLGGGDVKLFSSIGGIIGVIPVFRCILYSFLCGAVLSLAILSISGDFIPRLLKFKNYIHRCMTDQKLYNYQDSRDQCGRFHFTIAILMGVLLWTGGL